MVHVGGDALETAFGLELLVHLKLALRGKCEIAAGDRHLGGRGVSGGGGDDAHGDVGGGAVAVLSTGEGVLLRGRAAARVPAGRVLQVRKEGRDPPQDSTKKCC